MKPKRAANSDLHAFVILRNDAAVCNGEVADQSCIILFLSDEKKHLTWSKRLDHCIKSPCNSHPP